MKRLQLRLNGQLALVCSGFVVAMGVTIVLAIQALAVQSELTGVVNVAGRQRMLNQRHTKEVLAQRLGQNTDAPKTFALLSSSVETLADGGDLTVGSAVVSVPAWNGNSVGRLFEKQRSMLAEKAKLTSNVATANDGDLADAMARLEEFTNDFHTVANNGVTEIAEYSRELAASDRNRMLIGAVVSLQVALGCGYSVATSLRRRLTSIADLIDDSTDEIFDAVDVLSSNAIETATQATQSSAGATEVAQATGLLTSSLGQFGESIREISGNTSAAVSVANEGVEVARTASTSICKLGESSSEIGNVIQVINSIAEQTNLLALNATIEAARAGEAGKGFAVVANEVKDLAKATSTATEEIIAKVTRIQSETDAAVSAISEVDSIIGNMSDAQTAIAGAVEEQSAMIRQITESVSETDRAATEIGTSTATVAAAADSTADHASSLSHSAHALDELRDQLRSLVQRPSAANLDGNPSSDASSQAREAATSNPANAA